MDIEVRQIVAFLREHEPWSSLPAGVVDGLAPRLRMRYFRRGTTLLAEGSPNDTVLVIRSGVVDISSGGVLVERAEPGTAVGVSSAASQGPSSFGLVAVEDTLALALEGDVFRTLLTDHEAFAAFFDRDTRRRMSRAVAEQHRADDPSSSVMSVVVGELGDGDRRPPVTATGDLTAREAARLMTDHDVSALLVTAEDQLVGIVTDRDLRTKVVAAGLDTSTPLSSIMTPDPFRISPGARAFEAMLEMTTRRIHHLPITEGGRPVGMVSSGDLVRLERAHPVHLARDIARATDAEQVAALGGRAPALVSGFVHQGASAAEIGRVLTAIADAITTRLLTLLTADVTAERGEAPARWCWLALGSQARHETGLSSDQDHALLIADDAPAGSDDWFADLAQRMQTALVACGYHPCPGNMMATNPRWRLTESQWRQQFLTWLDTPTSEALFHAGTFFDARPLAGDLGLFASLGDLVARVAPVRPRFLTHLAAHAVQRQPPLGFLGNFVVERHGGHTTGIDLKAGGSHAIIEMARVRALAAGVREVSTDRRLAALAGVDRLGSAGATELRDAFEFITLVRLRHQAAQVTAGQTPTNLLDPDDLSRSDRRHLKDAFGIIRSAQTALAMQYSTSGLD